MLPFFLRSTEGSGLSKQLVCAAFTHETTTKHSTSSHWPRCRMCVSYLPYPRRMRIFRAVRILPIRAPVDPVVGPLLDAGCRCIPRFSRCRIRGHTSDGVTVTVTLPPFRHHGLRLCRVLTVTSWVTAPGSTE